MNELPPRREDGMWAAGPVTPGVYDGGELVYEESAGLIESHPVARFALIGLLIVAILVSVLPAREHFSDPSAYQTTIQTLDEKKTNVTVMIAVAMGASAGITLIPDDTGTPIADKLADVAGDLAIVLGALYLEKYLLTIFGTAAFLILIPAACLALIAWLALFDRWPIARVFPKIAARLALLGLILVIAVPVSTAVTRQIDETYGDSAAIMADKTGQFILVGHAVGKCLGAQRSVQFSKCGLVIGFQKYQPDSQGQGAKEQPPQERKFQHKGVPFFAIHHLTA